MGYSEIQTKTRGAVLWPRPQLSLDRERHGSASLWDMDQGGTYFETIAIAIGSHSRRLAFALSLSVNLLVLAQLSRTFN